MRNVGSRYTIIENTLEYNLVNCFFTCINIYDFETRKA